VSPFKVLLHRRAERALYKLPKRILRQVYDLVSELEIDPVPWRTWDLRKIRGEEDTYRVRLGRYRVIYWVDWTGKEVIILRIAPRKKAYEQS